MYAMMLASESLPDADLGSLTRSTVGGQTIALETIEAWELRSGAPLLELWGMTELAGLGTTHSFYAPNVRGSIGVALPGMDLRIDALDGGSVDLPAGERGEIVVRGPLVMAGYYKDAAATDAVTTADGWMRTGDVGYRTSDSHIFVVDRAKDVIFTAGYNVYPAEIERVLATHPDVALAAVGPIPDEIKGELACAYVVLRQEAAVTDEQLIDYCRDALAAYKVPRTVRFVEALPMTSSGKVMRRRLVDL